MLVRIYKVIIEAESVYFQKRLGINAENIRYSDYHDLNLARLTPADTEELRGVIAKLTGRGLRGSATLLRDIEIWQAAHGDGKKKHARIRNIKQAANLFQVFIMRHCPRKHLYLIKNQSQADGSVPLCYYIEDVIFHDRRDYNPAHIDVSLIYIEQGVRHAAGRTYYAGDVVGKTALEALTQNNLFPETPQLRADYEYYQQRFYEIRDKVGTQYLGRGHADTEGIDNEDDEDRGWWGRQDKSFRLDLTGEPTRCVIDIARECDTTRQSRGQKDCNLDATFWLRLEEIARNANRHISSDGCEEINQEYVDIDDNIAEKIEEAGGPEALIEIPVHPFVPIFDLKRHKRMRIHVGQLEDYVYDTEIKENLILPEKIENLLGVLLAEKETHFRDVVRGKSGGVLILLQGPPGTGKTLTTEIYAECLGRPLFNVQCSQLGMDPDELEKNLMITFARARRWGAIVQLDEADVYVTKRGSDLTQNAIVGVFLRTLEYFGGIMFMTTSRQDLVDDAILSRCTARIPYEAPSPADQEKIWCRLAAVNDIWIEADVRAAIIKAHPGLSGRDVKNLLKLADMMAKARGVEITADLITEAKIYKPTVE